MEEPTPTVWADDGTTWDTPVVVLSDGPASVILDAEDMRGEDMLPRSGRIGFTVDPGPA